MAVDTGLEPAVRSSRIICFQDRLLTIRIIHHIFNLRIHFILLFFSDWAVTVIVIRSYRPTTYAYAFLTSNCHTRHGISVLHISLVDSDELYITFGFILLLPINFRHSFGCHTVSSPPDRPKSVAVVWDAHAAYSSSSRCSLLSLCGRRAGQALGTPTLYRPEDSSFKGWRVTITLWGYILLMEVNLVFSNHPETRKEDLHYYDYSSREYMLPILHARDNI